MISSPRDYFEEIGRFAPISAMFLTYTLDKEVIEKLAEVCPGTIIILHDHRHGVSISDNHKHKLVCLPVLFSKAGTTNCFHPKMALLRNESEAMIMIGSANLAKDAFVKEKELVATGRMMLDDPQCVETVRYFRSLEKYLVDGKEILRESLRRFEVFGNKYAKNSNHQLFFNEEEAVFDQLDRLLPRGIIHDGIHIMTPFLPKEVHFLRRFRERFPAKKYIFHLRRSDKTTNAIKKVFPDSEIVSPSGSGTFHYKAIIFRTSNTDWIAVGSANFTSQGFFRSARDKGNMESMLLTSTPTSVQLTTWLKNGWKKPVDISEVEVDDTAAVLQDEFIDSPVPYAFAEREGKSTKVFIYLPDPFFIRKVHCQPPLTKRWTPVKDMPGFYEGIVGNATHLTLESRAPSWKEKICVFDKQEFDLLYDYHGDSLFSDSEKTYSVRNKELREALRKAAKKVSVGVTHVSQRPFLEQYFRNLTNRLDFLERRKYFSAWHESELKSLLEEEQGGTGCFQTIRLLHFFDSHPAGRAMAELCRNRFSEYVHDDEFKKVDLTALSKLMKGIPR